MRQEESCCRALGIEVRAHERSIVAATCHLAKSGAAKRGSDAERRKAAWQAVSQLEL
jgi:hypothetical protein